jgi:hypothetical protein
MQGKYLTKLVIQGTVFHIYIWDDIQAMNAFEESMMKKYMAFPDRWKVDMENPYGADGFIIPAKREIHLVQGELYDDEIVLRNLAHEVAHAIFNCKNKDDYYKDEKIVDACAETYAEIYKCVEEVRHVMESRKPHA